MSLDFNIQGESQQTAEIREQKRLKELERIYLSITVIYFFKYRHYVMIMIIIIINLKPK